MQKKSRKSVDKLLKDLVRYKKEAKQVMTAHHLDFDTLYAQAEGKLTGARGVHAQAHLAVCEECQAQLAEMKKAKEIITGYQPKEIEVQVPERVLHAIPKPKRPRGAYAQLVFNANRILESVQGVVKSMGGMLENLADFTVEALAPDTQFLAGTRRTTFVTRDYRTRYQDFEIIFSTLPEQNVVEVYLRIEGKKSEELNAIDFQLVRDQEKKYQPASKAIINDTLKLVFSDLDLASQSYEFRIPS